MLLLRFFRALAVLVVLLGASELHAAPKSTARPAPAAPAAASKVSRDWTVPEAKALALEGVEAKKNNDPALCIKKDQASLALEDHPYVKLHLAACLTSVKRYKDALIAARDVLAAAIKDDEEELKKAAAAKVSDILPRLAKLKIEIPDKTEGLKITMNGQELRPGQVRDKLTLDPKEYTLVASKEEKGERYSFRETISLEEGDDKIIEILPKQDHLSEDRETCLHQAKSYRERLTCIEEPESRPNVHVGIAIGGYTDSTSVHVLTPTINAAIVSPTGGWSVGGSYVLDIVSAASPDLVSTASPAFKEQRHAGSLGGAYKFDFAQIGLHANVSSEPDYLSRTAGFTISKETHDKSIVPSFGYSFSYDTIGYRNTPFSQFHRNLFTNAADLGVTFVISPSTLLVTGLSLGFENGENAKLYRFVPMFDAKTAAVVPAGASAIDVNDVRLALRPRENVPSTRDRVALGARLNHRHRNATLRLEERLYTDSWGIKASTTDARYLIDVTPRIRIYPHVRLHAQSGASFYQLAYVAGVDSAGKVTVPEYRTSDRESSPFVALTGGGGLRLGLSDEKSSTQYAIVASGDLMYNRYFSALYITGRTAVWGTVGFDADF